MRKKSKKAKEILDYDQVDTSSIVDKKKRLKFEDIGLILPPIPPTQVVSIRLPSELLNQIKALGSRDDVPYQAIIKLLLADGVRAKTRSRSRKYA